MLKTAAKVWGLPETETESNFDPLVGLLLNACSEELEKISDDIEHSRARVLERLVQLLAPEALTGALPASSIAYTFPVEPVTGISAETQFFVSKRFAPSHEGGNASKKDIFFSPAGSFHLHKATIKWIAAGTKLFSIQTGGYKETAANTRNGVSLHPNHLWVGIEAKTFSLKDMLFYFEMPQVAWRSVFFHQLPKAEWYYRQQPVKTEAGFHQQKSNLKIDVDAILNRDVSLFDKMLSHVQRKYQHQFITCLQHVKEDAAIDEIPKEIKDAFYLKDIEAMDKTPVHWVCISFPQNIHAEILEQAIVHINCFPVLNARLMEMNTRLRQFAHIVALQSDDMFLDLHSVNDADGKLLHLRKNAHEKNDTSVQLRYGGVGRFDARDAVQVIENVMDLVRDESVAFSMLGTEMVAGEITSLQQSLNKLQQRLDTNHIAAGNTPYLIVNRQDHHMLDLFIKFWVTNGAEANNIKAGTEMQLYRAAHVDSNSPMLMLTTQGGRNRLGDADKVLAYKNAMLSRERLVTAEDIASYARLRIAMKNADVKVQKGIAVMQGERNGFIKTIETHITLNKKELEQLKEKGSIEFWQQDLQSAIEQRSGFMMPVKIFIKEKDQ